MAKKNLINKIDDLENDLVYLKNQNDNLTETLSFIKKMLSENMEKTNYCPICGQISSFESFGGREKVRCPICGSLERHRLIYLLFERKFANLLEEDIKVLHFAPEHFFYRFFDEKDNIDYYPVDFCPENFVNLDIKYKIDIRNIDFDKDTFDLIYASHVLEHIPEDIKAMRELYRVLKPNGICIVMVPLINNPKTFENRKYNTPKLRLKHYGLEDHFRIYGWDIKEKLSSVGFEVEEINAENILTTDEFSSDNYRLRDEVAFICKK